jgi:hypothetical protein
MKAEGKIWVIFNSEKHKKTKPLSVVQAQVMILGFKSREMSLYFIWTPGWHDWQPLSEFLVTEQKYFAQAQPPEPPRKPKEPNKMLKSVASALNKDHDQTQLIPQRYTEVAPEEFPQNVDYGYYYNEFTGDDLTLSGIPEGPSVQIKLSRKNLSSAQDRRIAPRHEFKIEAILITKKGASFRSYSRNISLSGTMLEDEVPKDFFNRPFEMILINQSDKEAHKNKVHITGRIIGDLSNPRRLIFIGQNEQILQRLKKLIDSYNLQQAKIRKDGA